jgi:transposase-like protein
MATIATELIESKRDERGRKITPRAEREAVVRAYETSGLTQKAFAERERINYTTFVSWVQECRRRDAPAKVGFAELALARSAAPVEVQLPDGTVIRGSKAEEVARLVQLVRC